MEFARFERQHLEEAADLLIEQFIRWVKVFPLLPNRVTSREVARNFLSDLFAKDESHGTVSKKEGRVTGFLMGTYADNPFFGRHMMVPYGGMGMEAGTTGDELGKLYAAAGEEWIKNNVLNHYLVMPALPDWLEAGCSLSFGKEQAYAIAPVVESPAIETLPDGIVMRKALPEDASGLYDCADWIAGHYNLAPVWEPVPAAYLANIREGYRELATDIDVITWLALDGERIVSFVVIYPEEVSPGNLLGDIGIAHFAVAATHPDYRKRGIGRTVLLQAIHAAFQMGYELLTTDWRTTNPVAATHWLRFGFVPYAYRMLRRVNPHYQKYFK